MRLRRENAMEGGEGKLRSLSTFLGLWAANRDVQDISLPSFQNETLASHCYDTIQ